MSRPIINAVVEAGLVPSEALDELAQWGIHITADRDLSLSTPEAIAKHLRDAIESEEQVRIDETDLDLLHTYLDTKHQKKGRLILKEGKRHTTSFVTFCLTPMGGYAIPWTDEDFPDILINGQTHLRWQDEGDSEAHDVYFSDLREVFFGGRKMFVVCTPAKEEE